MPTIPLYTHRLKRGVQQLSAMSIEWIDRRTLEEILGVSKWTAWRIMKRCGAEAGPGGSLVCPREGLIGQLQALQQDGRFAPEMPAGTAFSGISTVWFETPGTSTNTLRDVDVRNR